jgi:hypothetical protein
MDDFLIAKLLSVGVCLVMMMIVRVCLCGGGVKGASSSTAICASCLVISVIKVDEKINFRRHVE